MNSGSASTDWWRECAHEFGPKIMDKVLEVDSDFGSMLASGTRDLQIAFEKTGMKSGREFSILEVGCGMGRITFNLAQHYGSVVGTDVSDTLLQQAEELNNYLHVSFEASDGSGLNRETENEYDVIFSYEVFHYLERTTLFNYFQDAFELLKPGGQFVFEINAVPIRLKTRASEQIRKALHVCGVKEWRGWPTNHGFQRKYHPTSLMRSKLEEIGFRVECLNDANPAQTWTLAVKPHDA